MVTPSKPELRQLYLAARNSLSDTYRKTASAIITRILLDLPSVRQSDTVSTFVSYGNEVDTHPLIDTLISSGKRVAVPKVDGLKLRLYQINSTSECSPGVKGILEPPADNPEVDPKNVAVFIVPGLAFDSEGYRLGYGGGYYDKLLRLASGYRIGVCYTDQMIYKLPHDDFDVAVDLVVADTISVTVRQ